jgi:hypothetical protein
MRRPVIVLNLRHVTTTTITDDKIYHYIIFVLAFTSSYSALTFSAAVKQITGHLSRQPTESSPLSTSASPPSPPDLPETDEPISSNVSEDEALLGSMVLP